MDRTIINSERSILKIKTKISLHELILFLVFFSRINNFLYESDIAFMAAIILASCGIFLRIKKLLAQPKGYTIWLLVFLSLYIGSLLWSQFPEITRRNFFATLGRAIIMVYIFASMTNAAEIKQVIKVFTLSVIVNDLWILGFYGPGALIQARVTEQFSEAGNNNAIGMSSAYALVLTALVHWNTKKTRLRLFEYVFLALLVILSGSKKAFLIIFFALGIYYILTHKNRLITLVLVGIIAVVVYELIISVPALYLAIGNRVQDLVDGAISAVNIGHLTTDNLIKTSLNSSDRVRVKFILYGVQWIKEKPFVGHGMASFIGLYGRMYAKSYYAHNNYIEIAVGMGFVGLIAYYSLYFGILIRAIKTIKSSTESKIAFTIVLLILVLDFGLVSYLEIDAQFALCIAYLFSFYAKIIPASDHQISKSKYSPCEAYLQKQ